MTSFCYDEYSVGLLEKHTWIVHEFHRQEHQTNPKCVSIKEVLMKTTVLVAMLAVFGLLACDKKPTLKPASPDMAPKVEKQAAIPGPAATTGQASGNGEQGVQEKPADTVLVLPEKH
jgi:hypothetical protein